MTLTQLINKRQEYRWECREEQVLDLTSITGKFRIYEAKVLDESEVGLGVAMRTKQAPETGELLSLHGLKEFQVCWVENTNRDNYEIGLLRTK